MELAGEVLLGLLGGRWLDQKLHTGSTLALVGLGLGLAAAVQAVYRALKRANREADRIEQEEHKARKDFNDR